MKPPPPDTVRVESRGSLWFIDEENLVYLRMPKTEGPRSSPPGEDWGGAEAGALQDLVWHAYTTWELTPSVLRVYHDGTCLLTAPLP